MARETYRPPRQCSGWGPVESASNFAILRAMFFVDDMERYDLNSQNLMNFGEGELQIVEFSPAFPYQAALARSSSLLIRLAIEFTIVGQC